MAVDIKDVEQVAQELQQKFDDRKKANLPGRWKP